MKQRMMWSRMSVDELVETPGSSSWNEIRKRMNQLSIESPQGRSVIEKIAVAVKKWPIHISRPPDKSWRRPDPRLEACLVIDEEATYKPIKAALCAAFVLRSGRSAVKLRRRWVGKALDPAGNEIEVNELGEADLSGWLIIERPDGGFRVAVYLSVEVKMDSGVASPEQIEEARKINEAGGIAIICKGIQAAIEQIADRRKRIMEELGWL